MMDDQRLETRVMNGNRLDEFIHIVVALGGGLDNTEALELLKAFVHLRIAEQFQGTLDKMDRLEKECQRRE